MVQFPYFDVLLLLWLVWGAYWLGAVVYERATRQTKATARRPRGFPFVFLTLLIVLLSPLGGAGQLGDFLFVPSTLAKVLGLAITASSVGFAIAARRVLGANWSGSPAVKKGHTLVTSGPYSVVRHPIYTGILFGVSGSLLVLGTYGSLCILVLTALMIWTRVRVEERLMHEQFGEEYVSYRRRTKMIIPLVW